MSFLDNRKNDPTVPPEQFKSNTIIIKDGIKELNERLDMMSKMYNETYNDALEFKEQRDELLRASERLISTIDKIVKPSIINNEVKIFKETVNGIKGDDK